MKDNIASLTNVILNKLVPTIDKILTIENTLVSNQIKMNIFSDKSALILSKISEGINKLIKC